MFTDIRNFTTIAEGFMPDELVEHLNRYFDLLGNIILQKEGIVNKYIGDAIMGFFGAPIRHPDDAERALRAALEMQKVLVKFNSEMKANENPPFKTGIGVSYGWVTVGNIGFEKKMEYTVIGDPVNYGSRLEGLTKMYKQDVIVSASIFMKVKGIIPCRPVDMVSVKGRKKNSEMVYTASLDLTKREKEGWAYHNGGIKRYLDRQFKEAIKYFQAVKKCIPDDFLADLFIERCIEYVKAPPPSDWTGVTEMETK